MNIPRPEYPRPQFKRDKWVNLNGEWQFEIDNGVSGRERKLFEAEKLNDKIILPFCPESELSGIGNKDFMQSVWYRREVQIDEDMLSDGQRIILNIGACDWKTEVWVNGKSQGTHIGGYISFSFDITDAITVGKNVITICADDNLRNDRQPSGKQSKQYDSYGCLYTRTTGIWQTVWIECVPAAYIEKTFMTPEVDSSILVVEAICKNAHGKTLTCEASYQGKPMGTASGIVCGERAYVTVKLDELYLWNVGDPKLYDLKLTLGEDTVDSYFGMRSIVYVDNKLLLNGKPVFQRLILDQGFYPDGIYTAPTDAELVADITRSMDMGFNGARLHEKIFEPRFLHHCDRLGYIVWGEHANWGLEISRDSAYEGFVPEWLEEVERDYNHPALVGWCPLNETQGDQRPDFVRYVYHITKALDKTRPVIDASGWTHVITDILDGHDYDQNPVTFNARYRDGGDANPDLSFVSEYGGIRWSPDNSFGWGYGDGPKTEEEFIERYKGLTEALLSNPRMCAFCYTQLTDVEQEVNGLYTYDRKAKFDPAVIKAINTQVAAIEK